MRYDRRAVTIPPRAGRWTANAVDLHLLSRADPVLRHQHQHGLVNALQAVSASARLVTSAAAACIGDCALHRLPRGGIRRSGAVGLCFSCAGRGRSMPDHRHAASPGRRLMRRCMPSCLPRITPPARGPSGRPGSTCPVTALSFCRRFVGQVGRTSTCRVSAVLIRCKSSTKSARADAQAKLVGHQDPGWNTARQVESVRPLRSRGCACRHIGCGSIPALPLAFEVETGHVGLQ